MADLNRPFDLRRASTRDEQTLDLVQEWLAAIGVALARVPPDWTSALRYANNLAGELRAHVAERALGTLGEPHPHRDEDELAP